MYECEQCGIDFYDQNDLLDHYDDDAHWPECETCHRQFKTQNSCNQHMNNTQHWAPTYDCETCDETFRTQNGANNHMAGLSHWENYCSDCDRGFDNANNLKQHMNSRIHRGTNVPCPFCKTKYTTASGLSHHLETGSCSKAPRLNRETILQFIRERDPSGLLTTKQITFHEETTATYSATDRAWNGRAWECYLCHRGFGTDRALNQHLNSPAHKQKVYHCPKRSCGKEFVSLAALFGHLESEACSFMRFEAVQVQVGNVLSGNRMLTFG